MATQQKEGRVVILGIFVTDLTFRADRMPLIGETIAGNAFKMACDQKWFTPGKPQFKARRQVQGPVNLIAPAGEGP